MRVLSRTPHDSVRGRGWGGGGGGYEGKKRFVYLKWASPFWTSVQNFISDGGDFFWFLGVGGWFGRGGGGGVRQITPPPAPPPADKHGPVTGSPWRLRARGAGGTSRCWTRAPERRLEDPALCPFQWSPPLVSV